MVGRDVSVKARRSRRKRVAFSTVVEIGRSLEDCPFSENGLWLLILLYRLGIELLDKAAYLLLCLPVIQQIDKVVHILLLLLKR
jgi:hypothetical protein